MINPQINKLNDLQSVAHQLKRLQEFTILPENPAIPKRELTYPKRKTSDREPCINNQ